jgi:CDP-diacylglycerol--serine O-phosphatidyltransferase
MTLSYFFLVGVLPLVLFFLIERFFLSYYMTRSEHRKNIIRNQRLLQPNFIGRARYPMGLVTVAILYFSQYTDFFLISEKTAFYFWTVWMISDVSDGTIARHYSLDTKEGAAIDPLSDKLMQFPLILYLSYLGYLSIWIVFIYILIDTMGQLLRSLKSKQQANLFGKGKTFLIVVLITLIYSQHIFWGKLFFNPSDLILGCAILLSVASICFRFIPNYYYGNMLSFTNFFCGILGIILILWDKEKAIYAFLLVFLGQFLDLYDGRAVRKWGGTKRGELYDDIADGTNFGGTVSFIIFATVAHSWFVFVLMFIYFNFTIYRLYRFILDKRKNKLEKTEAVSIFQGLPSPAGASLVGSGLLVLSKYQNIFSDQITLILQILLVFIASFLMVSKIPYIHFAQQIIPNISNSIKAISMIFIILLLLWGFDNRDFSYLSYFVFLSTVGYLIFGIQISKAKTHK